ncbi:MAG: hypothetical protein BWY38_02815 [Ignavibacteria bacterium ADurb.Bin266]|nr:MAG: hypothetical protein BWY38_02815 [Ignavibacteria bacterium ADurb.Bin266]
MARKKVVLVIVEGPTDEDALGIVFKKYFDNYSQNALVEVMHCDITTEWNGYSKSIREKITDVVKKNAQKNKYNSGDYSQIIHIVDTDGAFIDDKLVIEDTSIDTVSYSLTNIICKDRIKIIERNAQKSKNLRLLVKMKTIWNVIPYHVYYMSCNLDHVLYDIQNSSNEEKEQNAHEFAKKYRNNVIGFMNFISSSLFSINCPYKETWEFIQKGVNSLERHTNLQLCFEGKEFVVESENLENDIK